MKRKKLTVAALFSSFFIALVALTGCATNTAITPDAIYVTSESGETSIKVDETMQLKASVEPSSAAQSVVWESLNPDFASISETGLVLAKAVNYEGVTLRATSTLDNSIAGDFTIRIEANLTSISEIRSGESASEFTIGGIVTSFVYTGQSTPYITGFFVSDETGCIYVFGENTAKKVALHNYVVIKGSKTYYIPQTDTGGAASVGYIGAQQLTSPTLLYCDNSADNSIPETAIIDAASLSVIQNIPLTTDITGNLYRAKGRIRQVIGTGFTNYYLDDLNRVGTMLFYTQSNGKDFEFLESYNGKSVSMLVTVILGKPSVNEWRLYPTNSIKEITISDAEEAKYGVQRALDVFADSYGETSIITFSKTDPALASLTRSVSSTSSQVNITNNENDYTVTITVSEIATCQIAVSVVFNEASDSASKSLTLGKRPVYTATTIAEARKAKDGESVTLDAIIARLTYKNGTDDACGAFIVDETGSFLIYNSADYMSSLSGVSIGNKIAFSGTITHFIASGSEANYEANNYAGDFQVSNITLIYNDRGNHSIPSTSIETKSIQSITETTGANNISGSIYKVVGKLTKSSSVYYSTYYVKDSSGTYSLNVYSQKNGADFTWLDTYLDRELTMYLGVQNAKVSASSLTWRVCPISIL